MNVALTKLSTMGWKWKGGKKFAHGTRLCVEFNVVQGGAVRGDPPVAGPCGKNR